MKLFGSQSRSRALRGALRIALAAGLLATVLLSLAGCGARTPASVTPPEYVALGDSFTAGTGIKPQATKFVPNGCRQSLLNYPHLVARELGFVAFADASCGGAQIPNMTEPQDTGDGVNDPQLDRVDDETLYVSLSIGGNDAGFDKVVTTCLRNENPATNPCVDTFGPLANNELIANATALRPGIEKTIDEIKLRAPRAKVVLIGYPRLLPPAGIGCGSNVGVSPADATIVNSWLVEINRAIAGAAAAKDSEYVDLYGPSEGHDACQPRGTRWAEPGSGTDGADSFHPNEAGELAAARSIARVLEALSGPSGATGPTD